jgi:hypothetical protein
MFSFCKSFCFFSVALMTHVYNFSPALTARCRYFIAVHAGFKEMREGITFVIDTTDDSMLQRQGELARCGMLLAVDFAAACRQRGKAAENVSGVSFAAASLVTAPAHLVVWLSLLYWLHLSSSHTSFFMFIAGAGLVKRT